MHRWLGRGQFISRDPVEGEARLPITWGAYQYGRYNPYRYTDPNGECDRWRDCGTKIAGYAIGFAVLTFNRWGSSVALYGVMAGIIRSVSFHQTTQSFSLKLCVSNGQESMGEIRVKKDNLTSEFDKAFQLFFEGFLRIYPKETWPSWFRTSTNYGGCKKSEGVWEFCFTGIPSSVLGAGDSWEEWNGGYILVKTDPDTGAKRYIISNASNEVFVIFKAVVDINSENFSVVFSTDIYEIDGRDLLPLRK